MSILKQTLQTLNKPKRQELSSEQAAFFASYLTGKEAKQWNWLWMLAGGLSVVAMVMVLWWLYLQVSVTTSSNTVEIETLVAAQDAPHYTEKQNLEREVPIPIAAVELMPETANAAEVAQSTTLQTAELPTAAPTAIQPNLAEPEHIDVALEQPTSVEITATAATELNPADAEPAASVVRQQEPRAHPAAQPPAVRVAVPSPAERPRARQATNEAGEVNVQQHAQVAFSAEDEFSRASSLFRRGDNAEAERALQVILERQPQFVSARLLLIGMLEQQQRYDSALAQIIQARSNRFDYPRIEQLQLLLAHAQLLVRMNRSEDAIELLLPLVSNPEAVVVPHLSLLGALTTDSERYSDAQEVFKALAQLQPNTGRWWLGLANASEFTHDYATALEAYNRALHDHRFDTEVRAYMQERYQQLSNAIWQ